MSDETPISPSDPNAPADEPGLDAEKFGPAVVPSAETLRQLLFVKIMLFVVGLVLLGSLVVVVTGA